jgi:hypothetical protein
MRRPYAFLPLPGGWEEGWEREVRRVRGEA